MKEIIYQESQKQRLDKFLVNELADWSRTKIQRFIYEGQITVNGQTAVKHYQLKMNDRIIFKKTLLRSTSYRGQALLRSTSYGGQAKKPIQLTKVSGVGASKKANNLPKPEIIDETDDYLVINKPAGLIVHPAEGVKEKTLVDWLIDKYPKIKAVGEGEKRPGIIHRLDKVVSGLMVIAKNQKMFEHLKNQFQKHQIIKEYLGLVHGVIDAHEGVIDFPLKRSKISGKIVAKPKGEEGKNSITKFAVLKRFANYTYLKINLKTGRTHQIRAHLQAYGHPLAGDQLYKNKKIKDKLKLDRIFLHAHYLKFADLENEPQEYQNPLPDKLNQILTELK